MFAADTPLSILVADDEEDIRALLLLWLQGFGHIVTTVESGKEATRLVQERQFHLIITDVVMPDGDGFELISAFRKAQPSARIVAMSGGGKYLESGDCLKIARSLGAHAAVTKPFGMQQLQVGIERALSNTAAA